MEKQQEKDAGEYVFLVMRPNLVIRDGLLNYKSQRPHPAIFPTHKE
jgi:hypothetical protein